MLKPADSIRRDESQKVDGQLKQAEHSGRAFHHHHHPRHRHHLKQMFVDSIWVVFAPLAGFPGSLGSPAELLIKARTFLSVFVKILWVVFLFFFANYYLHLLVVYFYFFLTFSFDFLTNFICFKLEWASMPTPLMSCGQTFLLCFIDFSSSSQFVIAVLAKNWQKQHINNWNSLSINETKTNRNGNGEKFLPQRWEKNEMFTYFASSFCFNCMRETDNRRTYVWVRKIMRNL